MKIFVITGSRAEYGLLKNLIIKLKNDKFFNCKVVVTGSHLSNDFGYTIKEIIEDKIKIYKKINLNIKSDKPINIGASSGEGIIKFSKLFKTDKPDLLVVLGDRYEIISACLAGTFFRIPIAHIHGGESTEGLIDEAMRHSITKMSHIHFVSTQKYKKKVIQLGEKPSSVHLVGALGIEGIKKNDYLNRSELKKKLGITFNRYNLLTTFHPVTLEHNTSKKQFKNILNALKKVKNTNIFFTKTNSDTNGRIINELIDKFVKNDPKKYYSFKSLGSKNYYSIVSEVDCVLGNSSSGILEVPSFKIPTINIGDRQLGRIQAKSIFNCKPKTNEIIKLLRSLLLNKKKKKLKNIKNPYDYGIASDKIISVLKKSKLKNVLKKNFYEII